MSSRSPFISMPVRRAAWVSGLLLLTGAPPAESRADSAPEGAPVPTVDTAQQASPAEEDSPPVEPEALIEEEPENTPVVEVESSEAPALPTEGESTLAADIDLDSRPYDRTRPNWAFSASYSPEALGDGGTFPGASASAAGKVRGLSLQMEWEPAFIQVIGVLGLGLNAQLYPEYPKTGLTKTAASLFSYGAQVRYQLKFFRGQWIVPMAGYAAEQMQYTLPDSVKGSFMASGPFGGLMLLLNPLDPTSAGEFYAGMGVKRTYLFAEMRMRAGSAGTDGPKFGESSWFAGVRSEW